MIKIFFLLLLSSLLSCASIYTGKTLPPTNKEELVKVDKSVTFRFVFVGKRATLSGGDDYFFKLDEEERNNLYKYIKELKVFEEVRYFEPDDGDYELKKLKSLESFTRLYPLEFETDYFVNIFIEYKKVNHGTGTGMLGGLLSYLTLGIIPHYGTVNRDYTVNILSKNGAKSKPLKFKEKYGVLSAIWLWPLTSSEPTLRSNKLNKRELDKAHYLLKKIIGTINNEIN